MEQLRINIPLEVVVESPESPPSLPLSKGAVAAAAVAPRAPNWFMGWFSPEEIQSLEEWARAVRAGRMEPDFRIPEPEVAQNFRSGLRFLLVTQWEFVLVHPAGEVQFEVFRALVLRFNILTVNNRQQFQRGFSLWSAAERREQLECLANSSGFLVVE